MRRSETTCWTHVYETSPRKRPTAKASVALVRLRAAMSRSSVSSPMVSSGAVFTGRTQRAHVRVFPAERGRGREGVHAVLFVWRSGCQPTTRCSRSRCLALAHILSCRSGAIGGGLFDLGMYCSWPEELLQDDRTMYDDLRDCQDHVRARLPVSHSFRGSCDDL